MLIDGNHWTGGPTIETDICIVGTGMGGGTLVSRFGEAKTRFVIIEAGAARKSDCVQMECVGRPFMLPTTRSIELGGTSNLWHGVLAPLDRIDFEPRSWVPDSGWPLSLDDLLPSYREAARRLGVRCFEHFEHDGLPEVFRDQVGSMPFDRAILENKLFQQTPDALSFKEVVRRVVVDSPDQHCFINTVALELEPGATRSRVGGLLARFASGGEIRVRAKTFIIAAGALETPRLLLNSRKMSERGAGNEHDQVGRYLMDHPMGNLLQVRFRKPLRSPLYSVTRSSGRVRIKTGLRFTRAVQEREGLANHCFYIRPSFVRGAQDECERIKGSLLAIRAGRATTDDFLRVARNPKAVMQLLAYKASLRVTYRLGDLFFLTEQVPNPESRVRLSNKRDAFGYPVAQVDWKVARADIEGVERAFRILTSEALPREHFTFANEHFHGTRWEERFASAAHHMGTARMAASKTTGVVDASLRVFGIDNLYVCDGSVFATAGNANTSLTISALATRLAKHLSRTGSAAESNSRARSES